MYHAVLQLGSAALKTTDSTTAPAASVPIDAPRPFVISMNRPWADDLMSVLVFSLT